MELSFELLREAGLRMPGPAGNTIGIVGGLIVGQAAVSANLVSPITVTVAALTALGSFSIPNEELSEVFRLWKYGILLLGSCFGILGVMLGCFLLLMLMAEQESYGIPWLYPYVGGNLNERADEKIPCFWQQRGNGNADRSLQMGKSHPVSQKILKYRNSRMSLAFWL